MSNQQQQQQPETSPKANQEVTTREFAEAKLEACLKSIYSCTRISTELDALNSKLQSLVAIRGALNNDTNRPMAALETMNNTIAELEADIREKTKNMKLAERLVIDGFQDVISKVQKDTDEKVKDLSSAITKALERFGKSITDRLNKKLNETEKELESIKETKVNVSEKEEVLEKIESFKKSVIETQEKTYNRLYHEMTTQFREATKQSEKALQQLNYDTVSESVQSKVMAKLDAKLKESLEHVKKENARLIEQQQQSSTQLSAKITDTVSLLVEKQMTPDQIKATITSSPEYQSLLSMRDSLKQNPIALQQKPMEGMATAAEIKALMDSVARLSEELVELKQRTDSTRTVVDALKSSSTEQSKDVDYKAAVKHMEEMERQVTIIHGHIKMMETAVEAKSKLVEETADQWQPSSDADTSNSRKRPRLDSEADNHADDTATLLSRLTELENKHQKLLDFILQCKDTVLDDMFPTRLQAAMKKIEQVLVNHETFIAYLIDPFATSQRVQQKPNIDFNQETSTLTPAMLDAITQLVKKTAQDVSVPLQKRIKQLEEKLESQSAKQ
ncbi:hypothetical protein A0J61_04962 [Choanephora cucurbitarum]|uniref:Uncharacterized protein n=1 Tax=Choanephora cucurbitarum TaxID=101091 RepID=A0A1C7ND11_9FUNG|nr:hypothetical protein A0J61_04962 [Choanephora cucurbitarum]